MIATLAALATGFVAGWGWARLHYARRLALARREARDHAKRQAAIDRYYAGR